MVDYKKNELYNDLKKTPSQSPYIQREQSAFLLVKNVMAENSSLDKNLETNAINKARLEAQRLFTEKNGRLDGLKGEKLKEEKETIQSEIKEEIEKLLMEDGGNIISKKQKTSLIVDNVLSNMPQLAEKLDEKLIQDAVKMEKNLLSKNRSEGEIEAKIATFLLSESENSISGELPLINSAEKHLELLKNELDLNNPASINLDKHNHLVKEAKEFTEVLSDKIKKEKEIKEKLKSILTQIATIKNLDKPL